MELNAGEKPQEQQPDSQAQAQSGESAIDYSKIDWSKIDWKQVPVTALPEEVIKATPTAKALLEETIQRRQTIKQLKDALAEKPAETPKPETQSMPDDTPMWAKQLIEKVSSFEQQTQAQKIQSAVDAALVANKLPAEARKFIVGDTPEAIATSAADLAKMFAPSDPTSAGNPAGGVGGDIQSRAMQIIKQRIDGNKPVSDKGASIFDTAIQRIK